MKPRRGVRVEMIGTSQVRVEMPQGAWRLNPWTGEWSRPVRVALVSADGSVEDVGNTFRFGSWVQPRYERPVLGPPLFFNEVLRQ